MVSTCSLVVVQNRILADGLGSGFNWYKISTGYGTIIFYLKKMDRKETIVHEQVERS